MSEVVIFKNKGITVELDFDTPEDADVAVFTGPLDSIRKIKDVRRLDVCSNVIEIRLHHRCNWDTIKDSVAAALSDALGHPVDFHQVEFAYG